MATAKKPAAPKKPRTKKTVVPKAHAYLAELKLGGKVYTAHADDCLASFEALVAVIPPDVQFNPVLDGVLTVTKNGHTFERHFRLFALRQFFANQHNRAILADLAKHLGI
jgi:hypothetical protein